jgi:hypothetical protein
MSLDPLVLSPLIKEKLLGMVPPTIAELMNGAEMNEERQQWLEANPGWATGQDFFYKALSQAVIEHFTKMAEVISPVVGLAGGIDLLPPELQQRILNRGGTLPTLPDNSLQLAASPGSPTTAPTISTTLSINGLLT